MSFGRRFTCIVQLHAETHNILNHPYFSQPDTSLGTAIGATGQTRDLGKLD
jgi:hypothetical protein